ncbi:conserved exported hypothetical protein [Paraburkholderia piptadeniae]|uniref:DUF4148 domain-containing protein n=1 Tax=Paraburkholderia piptadeniae TaxID=1701573 RepID=A0A1N7SV94_9BURK|nr:DUF4148 domain-containing protein [Paraburkholderia piptadeniae]SIT51279.1 conserved exported hypothetical protein [Paraburkholderia piptadeniae]
MNRRTVVVLSIVGLAMAGISTGASAQGKTRAEALQELIQAEHNGLAFITDTSYPDVSPIFEQQVARMRQQYDSGTGGVPAAGSSERGNVRKDTSAAGSSACVGPISFCSPYFGS